MVFICKKYVKMYYLKVHNTKYINHERVLTLYKYNLNELYTSNDISYEMITAPVVTLSVDCITLSVDFITLYR